MRRQISNKYQFVIGYWKLDIGNSVKKRSGFTLIELLVVVAIIGVLSALLMSNFIGVRQRARDAQRKSDLRQLQSAIELYRADIGNYPGNSALSSCGGSLTASVNGQTSTYMQKIPCDPSTNSAYTYNTPDGGVTYKITACLENTTDNQKDSTDNTSACSSSSTWSYTVQNP